MGGESVYLFFEFIITLVLRNHPTEIGAFEINTGGVTPPLRFHPVICAFFLHKVQLNVLFYNSDFFIGQAVELIDDLINQGVGLLNAAE